jgi:trehalose/maltose hydrolase-like predicted phosphorylase
MRRSTLHAAGLAAWLLIALAVWGGPVAAAKPNAPRGAAKPKAPRAAAKPKAPRGAAKPNAPRVTPAPTTGASVLTATNTGPTYAPTFTGNGLLGVRVPPAGQGYAPGTTPSQSAPGTTPSQSAPGTTPSQSAPGTTPSQSAPGTAPSQSALADFYAQPPDGVQQRANIPTWSTLTFIDGGTPFSLSAGTTTGWRQSLDLRSGVVTTTAQWTAPDGNVTNLAYQVFTDRARPNVGVVQVTLTPQWSGTATVTDTIDGTPATLSSQVSKGWAVGVPRDFLGVQAQGTNIVAGLSSQLGLSANVVPTISQADQTTDQTVSQRLDFPVIAGTAYTITKYVGVASTLQTPDPVGAAQAQATTAATLGTAQLLRENNAAWASLWTGRIDVSGNRNLATAVNASEFYLWASTRAGVNLSVSPAGLSSNGYNGHIFWDAETWMFPALLAQHASTATGIDQYRFDRLAAARQHATDTGFQGARFPWESALDGTEQTPPPVSVNSEGLYEQHITADVALAQWQYYLATGDKRTLAVRGWPVLSQAAAFWASRATLGADGRYHINRVTGPDEENPNVGDEAYTNAAAKTTLRDAIAAAGVLKLGVPASWGAVAARLVVPSDPTRNIHPEFTGYGGQLVKQADVTLLQYPLAFPMSKRMAQNDINFYVPRTDPSGPSMSDATTSIDSSALGTPGCSSFVYTRRSVEPFMRDVFDQFSETRTGGAFTFMTGIGGFLQEFLYGYSGLRWDPSDVHLDPSLTGQLSGIVLRGLSWRGRQFTLSIGTRTTTVTVTSGRNLVLATPSGRRVVNRRRALVLPTRRPDTALTTDVVRCGRAAATSSLPGEPPLAAVDGSPATGWQPGVIPATLTVPVRGTGLPVRTATLRWGQQWPPAPGPNVPPPPGPATALRATSYTLQVSRNGVSWQTVAAVTGRTGGVLDVIHFVPTTARFARIQITAAGKQPPMLDELSMTG